MRGYSYNWAASKGNQGGQALVLVVLLMMAVILVGVLFVAVVSFNQESSQMLSDRMRADQLANAGLRFADYMLTYSPEGADWRPPFRPYVPPTGFSPTDPTTWTDANTRPVPPVYIGDPAAGPGSWIATGDMFGPDGISYTDDDYYMEEEVNRGWAGLVNPNPPGAPGPSAPYYVRLGFTRYPDPNNAGHSTGGPLDQVDISQGHFLLRITYDPGPPFEGKDVAAVGNNTYALQPDRRSKYLKIESIGVVAGTGFVWRSLVAYKALGLTDHVLWVTDRSQQGRPALLGFGPWIDMDNDTVIQAHAGQADVNRLGDFLVTHFNGPMRFNCPVELRGDNADAPPAAGSRKNEARGSTQISLVTAPQGYSGAFDWRPFGGGYLRDDRFEALGIKEGTTSTDQSGGSIPGQSTTINLVQSGTTSYSLWDSDSPNYSTYGGRVLDNMRSDNPSRNAVVDTLVAPDIFARDPATGQSRYHALTRDSGPVVKNSATNQTAHTGRYGHGPGIYIDNFADLQFVASDGTHNLQALVEDFLGNMAANDPRIGDSGWNATRTTYTPRGVEITLYNTPNGGLDPAKIVTELSPSQPLAPDEVWWPGHVDGQPGIKLTRHDQRWKIADPAAPDTLGGDSGTNVMYVDYPPVGSQVIFAEGNVRIKGILPKDPSASGRYNLTVVSGGTIYVDGQILSPQDVEGRYTDAKMAGCRDEENSYLALLARDCVVVNPTQLLPVLTQGLVTAAPDDPTAPLTSAQHWELSPVLSGTISSSWMFGAPPTSDGLPITGTSTNSPDRISLVPYHTGEDPGPSAVALALYNSVDNAWTNYDFSQGGPTPLYSFLFVPAGLVPAAPNVSETLSPLWAPLSSNSPAVPWRLNAGMPLPNYISATRVGDRPGDVNWLSLRYADPGLGGNGTNYWLKKFKLEALDGTTGSLSGTPKGAIHAKVNALMYAQEGCFFVIPGPLFDESATGPAAARFRRLNYDLEIRGAIAENYHADPAAWREWQDRWAYPQYFDSLGTPTLAWGTIRYYYDETLLAGRVEPATTLTGTNIRYGSGAPMVAGANLPKLPLLPTCPGLIYRGPG